MNSKETPLLIFFPSSPRMLPLSSVFKNSLAISVSPLLRSWHFLLPPLGVLRDFSCSVKSAAALMAGPSRAVIQTYKQLEYKFCQEFALAGSSSRGHKDLFIYLFQTSQDIAACCHLVTRGWQDTFNLRACRGFISKWEGGRRGMHAGKSWGWIIEVY